MVCRTPHMIGNPLDPPDDAYADEEFERYDEVAEEIVASGGPEDAGAWKHRPTRGRRTTSKFDVLDAGTRTTFTHSPPGPAYSSPRSPLNPQARLPAPAQPPLTITSDDYGLHVHIDPQKLKKPRKKKLAHATEVRGTDGRRNSQGDRASKPLLPPGDVLGTVEGGCVKLIDPIDAPRDPDAVKPKPRAVQLTVSTRVASGGSAKNRSAAEVPLPASNSSHTVPMQMLPSSTPVPAPNLLKIMAARGPTARLHSLDSSPVPREPVADKSPSGEVLEELSISDCSDLDADFDGPDPSRPKRAPQFAESSLTVGVGRGRALRQLLLGPHALPRAWAEQGLCPSGALPYGLVQHEGGPCGVLAAVQAFVLRFLLHGRAGGFESALSQALATILWTAAQASEERQAYVCLPPAGGGPHTIAALDHFRLFAFRDYEALRDFLEQKLAVFQVPRGLGVVLCVLSAALSRGGVSAVRGDMDTPEGALVVEHGYCAQELVNLLLTGRATSNVFDGVQSLGEAVMKGVPQRGQVGFLTYYEHFEYFQVGSHLKDPVHPIWVICSESHYSVLFSKSPGDCRGPRFDLHYYDQLARQDSEIRLTVTLGPSPPKLMDGEMSPPLEDTIRTKWPGAAINWNGADRIL